MWYTLRQLAELNNRSNFTALNLIAVSEAIRQAVLDHLEVEHQGRRLFAYATDFQGNYHFYHDANDIPTVLAPLWGFCEVDDPIWHEAVEFVK